MAKEQIVRGEARGMNTKACPEPFDFTQDKPSRRACPEPSQRACPEPSRREGILTTGIPSREELEASPGYPSAEHLTRGPMVVIECVQDIPCNPCEAACPHGAIFVGNPITNLPIFYAEKCDACGRCIPICPGQAIFRVDITYSKDKATVAFPYEFLPMPEKGDIVQGVMITVVVPKNLAMEVRSMKRLPRM